jgi:leucyl aminopeptidase (aminopeptidase T)
LIPVTCAVVLAAATGLAAQGVKSRQAGVKVGVSPDYPSIARQIVHDSVQVKERDGVAIFGDATKIPLMEAIALEVARAGGFPHMVLDSPALGKRILTEVPLAYLDRPNKIALAELKQVEVQIGLSATDDPAEIAGVPEERVALARKANKVFIDKLYQQPLRTVSLGNPLIPTPAIARFYDLPLGEFERVFWSAVSTPPATLAANARGVKATLAAGKEVRVRTREGTDLSLRLAGREVKLSDGVIHEAPVDKPAQVWLPAGEVYTAPDPTSVSGTVVVPLAEYRGIKIRNARLTFESGRLTRIEAAQNANVLRQAIAASSGDKDLFSFIDIGVNPNSHMIPKSDYCSFEMAGMVTIGIGVAPWSGSPNDSDFSQEFFVPRATVEVDGKTIVREGKIEA